MRRRRARRTMSAAVAIGMTAGLLGLAAGGQAAAADPVTQPGAVAFTAARYAPRVAIPYGAGTSGVLYRQEGQAGLLWTDWHGTTRTVDVPDASPLLSNAAAYALKRPKWLAAGTDTILTQAAGQWRGTDLGTGRSSAFQLPAEHTAVASAGPHLLTRTGTNLAPTYHLARWGGADTVTVGATLELPAPIADLTDIAAADASTLVVRCTTADGRQSLGLIDIATGRFTPGPATGERALLTADRLYWVDSLGDASWVPRDNPAAAPKRIDLKPRYNEVPVLGAAGDRLLVTWYDREPDDMVDLSGLRLQAYPKDGGEPVELLRHAAPVTVAAPDGGLVFAGGTDSAHWALRKAAPGSLALSELAPVAGIPGRVSRISLANGVLATSEPDTMFLPSNFQRAVTTKPGSLEVGEPVYEGWATPESEWEGPWSSGDGHLIRVNTFGAAEANVSAINDEDDPRWFRMNSHYGSLVDLTGRWVILNGTNPDLQYVGDLGAYDTKPYSRTVRAASVWDGTLWSATKTAGVLTASDVVTQKTLSTVTTGAPCVAKEIQAVGRWLYWSCGPTGPAGVWDRTAKKNIAVPSGEALIGDGYLVRYDKAAGKLLLTGFRDGTADDTHAVGDLPATAAHARGAQWTVDKFGGPVAYIAADQRIHLVPSGVATERVDPVETEVGTRLDVGWDWKARWLMSKPVSSWKIAFKNRATGKTVHTLTGAQSAGGGTVAATWNGRTASGAYAPNGSYTWTLTATPADGNGAAFTTSGTLALTGGAAVARDFVKKDGYGDLLAFTSAGKADWRAGTGTGAGRVEDKVSGTGWTGGNTVTAAVPFEDVSGDRCNDVLVRTKAGELRAYKPGCGAALKPTTAYKKIGTGWNMFDALTSPGDMSGDGRADLLGRTPSGDLYFYKGKGDGLFEPRVKIGYGWQGYLLAGTGDLDGDGKGDLVARDRSGNVWRYPATVNGTLGARTKIGYGWTMYDTMVGSGDLNGDGRADLLARDTSGVLWSYRGDGKGALAARTKVGGSWQMYKNLF
ncbi:FG-GAP-like repeat-containing protein [Streptomyces sp. NPDC048567]|uniref:FG-GAP-like repeat-containing protein n=1 Tax=Streptomyces sp. NPDC048567 TaxID=3365570 RepID=UPI0037127EA3